MKKLLFVCTGNICRSPTADACMRTALKQNGLNSWQVDSAGTHGYHVGEAPDPRAVQTAKKHHITMDGITARQVTREDFNTFDYIFAMDREHYRQLATLQPDGTPAQLHLYLQFANGENADVPDPYYGSIKDFQHMFNLIDAATQAMLKKLQT